MESTLTLPSGTAEIANSLDAYVIRKRPLKSLKGIGFISLLWVRDALEAGLFSSTRSYTLASIIAGAGDCDGRYCFLYLANLVKRCGGVMSLATVKRAIKDLVRSGLVRKLNRQQTRAFFAEELAAGKRWADRLPCVLELLVPASAYPKQTLAEINEVRAKLGEEPLDETTRPYPSVVTTAQDGENRGSSCDTDTCTNDACPKKNPGSVRGSVSTGEQNRRNRPDGPHDRIARIPDNSLFDPLADRERLGRAVDDLLRQGLGVGDVTALFGGVEKLTRPFPALKHRMHSLETARAFLEGSLGRGIFAQGTPLPPWTQMDDADPFARTPEFVVDSQGKAAETCPKHLSVRNVPGGTCALCGSLCRSVPDELMHEPVPAPEASFEGDSGPEPEGHPQIEEKGALDPDLLAQMSASMNGTGCASSAQPVTTGNFWLIPTPGLSPKVRALLAQVRELNDFTPAPAELDAPTPEQAKAC